MERNDRATARTVAAVAVLLTVALLAVAAAGATGFTLADDGPWGEELLNETRERYAAAETLTVEATVTASNGTATKEATVSAVAGPGNRSRVTVERGNRSVVAGTNGTAAWTFVPASGVTTIYRDGTVTTVGPLGNATAGHPWNASEGPGNHSVPTERRGNETVPGDLPDYARPADPHGLNWSAANRSVERVETTQYEGDEVHVVSITHADDAVDGEARLWIRAEDSVVVRQEVRTPNGTVTVDVQETRFDVSVADSTFRPPTADDGAQGLVPVDSAAELAAEAPFTAVALGDAGFAFERGVVSRVGAADGTTALARYANDSTTVTVVQTDATDLPVETGNVSTTTVDVDGRAVTVAERDDRVVAWWTANDTTVAVTGDLPRERLLGLVAAVEATDA